MDIKIKTPQDQARKAKVMLWTDTSYQDIERLGKIESLAELETALSEMFDIDLPEPKRSILLELYIQTMLFCRENQFKPEQTSALLSIIKSIHEVNIETAINNLENCYTHFKELLLCHSVRRPPFSINLFNSKEITNIYKYIYNSYIRHYRLYKYIFTPQVKLDLSLTYSEAPDQKDAALTLEDSCLSITEPEGNTKC